MSIRGFGALTLCGAILALAAADPALAHHPMGGVRPDNWLHGILSGLGHPILGVDHFAAVLAVGCLAALHRIGSGLVAGYVAATLAGAAVHVQGAALPAAEGLVALSVVALGAVLVLSRPLAGAAALALFAVVGLLHGYALGESIVGAERAPLAAYFVGLAVIQTAIGLGAMLVMRLMVDPAERRLAPARLVGAAVAGVGVMSLTAQLV